MYAEGQPRLYVDFRLHGQSAPLVVKSSTLLNDHLTLTDVAQWLRYCPEKQKVTGPILAKAHAWVVGLVLSWGAYEKQLIDVSLSCQCLSPSLSPSLPLSLKNK